MSDSNPSTPALLALKRFVRGTLRQVGLGLMSLIVILNVAGHTPSLDGLRSSEGSSRTNPSVVMLGAPSSPERSERSRRSTSVGDGEAPSWEEHATPASAPLPQSTLRPHRLLHSKMTSHRLTSARLSVPSQAHTVVSLADAQ